MCSYSFSFHVLNFFFLVPLRKLKECLVCKMQIRYSWLQITRTLANFNLALTQTKINFPLDFCHTFNVILPLITRTLDNSNLPLTWSSFFFPQVISIWFYPRWLEVCFVISLKSGGKKQCTSVRNIEFWNSHWRVVGIQFTSGGWCCLSQI